MFLFYQNANTCSVALLPRTLFSRHIGDNDRLAPLGVDHIQVFMITAKANANRV